MNGYIAQRRGRFYVVIYEGRDPVTGKELRRWHPAGTDRAAAERLATKLAAEETRRIEAVRSLTFGAYLTSRRSHTGSSGCNASKSPTAHNSRKGSAHGREAPVGIW